MRPHNLLGDFLRQILMLGAVTLLSILALIPVFFIFWGLAWGLSYLSGWSTDSCLMGMTLVICFTGVFYGIYLERKRWDDWDQAYEDKQAAREQRGNYRAFRFEADASGHSLILSGDDSADPPEPEILLIRVSSDVKRLNTVNTIVPYQVEQFLAWLDSPDNYLNLTSYKELTTTEELIDDSAS